MWHQFQYAKPLRVLAQGAAAEQKNQISSLKYKNNLLTPTSGMVVIVDWCEELDSKASVVDNEDSDGLCGI